MSKQTSRWLKPKKLPLLVSLAAVTIAGVPADAPADGQGAGNVPGTNRFQAVPSAEAYSRKLYQEHRALLLKQDPSAAWTNAIIGSPVPLEESRNDMEIVHSGSTAQRAALVKKLETRKDPQLTLWLVSGLKAEDPSAQSMAARMLADMNYCGPDAFDALVGLLAQTDPYFKTQAARALGNYRSPPQAQAVISALARALTNG